MLTLEVPSTPSKTGDSSLPTEVYNAKHLHPSRGVAASDFRPLRSILTAASRRSLGRISVPVWLIILSDQLPIVALVSRYLTNKLIGRDLIPDRRSFQNQAMRLDLNMRY